MQGSSSRLGRCSAIDQCHPANQYGYSLARQRRFCCRTKAPAITKWLRARRRFLRILSIRETTILTSIYCTHANTASNGSRLHWTQTRECVVAPEAHSHACAAVRRAQGRPKSAKAVEALQAHTSGRLQAIFVISSAVILPTDLVFDLPKRELTNTSC